MATERSRQLVLAALVVVLAMVSYRALTDYGSRGVVPATRAAATPGRGAARGTRPASRAATAPDVHIRVLDEQRPSPEAAERNLFRFRPKAAPPRPPSPAPTTAGGTNLRPSPSPPLPPIPLKFIGVIEVTRDGRTIAGLVDSVGHTYGGSEGDIIAGQYRILRIGAESIEMSYLDGLGRQTIRLSGS
jgi:hypothetical protein